jgi:hypothetical protein
MGDALEQVLRLVAEGRLTAAQAAPIIDALGASGLNPDTEPATGEATGPGAARSAAGERATASSLRIEITESGRKVVNLRIPIALGQMALDRIPGLTGDNIDLVRVALAEGRSGTLVQIEDGDGGVRISLE